MIRPASSPADYETARQLVVEYQRELGVDLCFQGFDAELNRLDSMYGPPAGALFLLENGSSAAGCVGIRKLSADTCEMKRLYVRSAARGKSTGRLLALEAIAAGRRLGYRRIVLDTLATMTAAKSLYASLGFREIPPYYAGVSGATYLERTL